MKQTNKYDITAILTLHNEGFLSGPTICSFFNAINYAEKSSSLKIESIFVLDSPDSRTSEYIETIKLNNKKLKVLVTEFKDQGLARNYAVKKSSGRYVAFLDGDDLWSKNWLSQAYEVCEKKPNQIIAHPEFNWFFEENSNLFIHADQESKNFNIDLLRNCNYWDALCLSPRNAYLEIPFCDRRVSDGFAYEDWHWNCATIEHGYIHKSVENTILFKRRRKVSQTIIASINKLLAKPDAKFWHFEQK